MVHFETLVKEPHSVVNEMLKNYFGINVNEARLDCAVRRNSGSKFRRKSRTKVAREMFDEDLIELGEACVRKMGQLLEKYDRPELPLELYW